MKTSNVIEKIFEEQLERSEPLTKEQVEEYNSEEFQTIYGPLEEGQKVLFFLLEEPDMEQDMYTINLNGKTICYPRDIYQFMNDFKFSRISNSVPIFEKRRNFEK